MSASRVRSALACGVLVPLAACATLRSGGDPGDFADEGKVITSEQIENTGARNAWDALQRTGTHLTFIETTYGEPRGLRHRGGRNSILLSSTPRLYVDGAQMVEFAYLKQIPAPMIDNIRILGGVDGTKYYGTGGGNGVIAVQTKSTRDE
jgi:hypothetical protein